MVRSSKQERSEEIRAQIERLLNAKPESGEEWATICSLEAEYVALTGEQL